MSPTYFPAASRSLRLSITSSSLLDCLSSSACRLRLQLPASTLITSHLHVTQAAKGTRRPKEETNSQPDQQETASPPSQPDSRDIWTPWQLVLALILPIYPSRARRTPQNGHPCCPVLPAVELPGRLRGRAAGRPGESSSTVSQILSPSY